MRIILKPLDNSLAKRNNIIINIVIIACGPSYQHLAFRLLY